MASIFSSTNDHEILDIESVRTFIVHVNQHIRKFLEDPENRNTLRQRCTSKLKIQKQEFFEFSEHSVLSNLYWGIESIEAAIQAKWPEEKMSRLQSSERMLQVPALVQEHGNTGGIQNQYIICCSYFYLSLVRKLQRDDWQVTLHFLQAMVVYPWLVRTEFVPELWESIFLPQIMKGRHENGLRDLDTETVVNYYDNAFDEPTRRLARRYKDCLMYYQVMLYGETPQSNWGDEIAPLGEVSRSFKYRACTGSQHTDSVELGHVWHKFQNGEKVHPLDFEDNITEEFEDRTKANIAIHKQNSTPLVYDGGNEHEIFSEAYRCDSKEIFAMKSLKDMLKDSQSDTPFSAYSCNESPERSPTGKCSAKIIYSEEYMDDGEGSMTEADSSGLQIINHSKQQTTCALSNTEYIELTAPDASGYPMQKEDHKVHTSYFFSKRFLSCISNLNLPSSDLRDSDSDTFSHRQVQGMQGREPDSSTFGDSQMEEMNLRGPEKSDFRLFDHISSQSLSKHAVNNKDRDGSLMRKKQDSNRRKSSSKLNLHPAKDMHMEIMGIFEKAISTFCFSEWVGQCEESFVEVSIMWEVLNNKTEEKYGLLKDEILDQLLSAISTSQEERVIRASVFILTTIISRNKAVIEDIKRKGLRLCDLASALKRKVHEAAILIYLINPSPTEIKALELLPALLEVACTSNKGIPISIQLTPVAASLMMIEVLVTAFDLTTNSMHLEAISSPPVLTQLVHAAIGKSTEEIISLAAILIKCMRFDGKCKIFLSQFTSMDSFTRLLRSKEKPAQIIALQFFHEILQMPRSSVISLLHQIRQSDCITTTHTLMSCIRLLEPEYKILASNLMLQLDMLDDPSGKSIFREEAMEILLEAIASEGSSEQILSASVLSNLGGTYSWTGEPYTAAWLVKRIGLTSMYERNMIRNFDWSDESLQDGSIDAWSSKVARGVITVGNPVFHALEKGLQSKTRSVSRDSLITIAWLGCEMAKISPPDLRYSASEILLSGIEQFLHPGLDLEERLLACLSVYNYASGKGMQKLIHFSEGVRESLRRLSSIIWIADELLRVTEYFLPANSRVSCVHTQILEAGYNCKVAACALIYYKGQLYSGHSDGSIKVWEIKGQTAMLVWEVKVHKKEVTCFTLSEPGDSLLSGSADKTIRVWQMVQRRLECVKVIETKQPISRLDSHKQLVFAITQSRGVKVFDTLRPVKSVCKSKHVKSMAVIDGKLYLGCTDSSIQEVDMTNEREREIKPPARRWWVQNKPMNAVLGYKDWFYSASTLVEGSILKERRNHKEAQMSIAMEKGKSVQAMGVVEDFIYVISSSSPSVIEIWLRGGQRKVGRLSAGSKITSILTANDTILCGTETGLIKGWIPL
ncbi:hypothetical protein ACHQM5_026638 [Ranunculus cassubicifolius]